MPHVSYGFLENYL